MTKTVRVIRRAVVAIAFSAVAVHAQDRFKTMPGYERYQTVPSQIASSFKSGALNVVWVDSGKAFEFTRDNQLYRFDIATRKAGPIEKSTAANGERGGRRAGGSAGRGRQVSWTTSPNGQFKAYYKDRNLWISDTSGANPMQITTDGSEKARVKNGTASWVYGEELSQTTAMWWSPSSGKIAYYRFDESKVPDYYLVVDQAKLQSRMYVEPYPKVGVDNPVVELFVYDVNSKASTKIDIRDGKPFENDVVGYYTYGIEWAPDGSELIIHRTNRLQNVMELAACHPGTGKCRVIVREEWLPSWTENLPTFRFLDDDKRFIWESERNGFKNLYLYDLTGKLHATLTNHPFEVASIVRVDEKAGVLYYMARDGENHMKLQLHRVGLDGKNHRRLTDPSLNHTVSLSPDGKHFVDVVQTHDKPPVTRLVDMDGRVISELATSDLSKFDAMGAKRVEMFTFKAADDTTTLHGLLHFPSNFDPSKKYPVLLSVYGGPATNGASERFTMPSRLTELGFLYVTLDARSADGRGKRFLDAIYRKLGVTEIDDMAAGIKSLRNRPYVDGTRVGIFGTSYGGYASLMALVRYPDVFAAAAAMSPVSDWRNYDTIYTERYMGLPTDNKAGYDAGSPMTYVKNMKGRLMLFFGTADDNVHPSNSMQVIESLQRLGKSFDLQLGPDMGHAGMDPGRMMEFFIDNLVTR